jgi:hypothetical protein
MKAVSLYMVKSKEILFTRVLVKDEMARATDMNGKAANECT